jgi:hypothetical protein
MCILMCSIRIQKNAGAVHGTFLCYYWINEIKGGFLLADFQLCAFSRCSSDIMTAPNAAPCIF